MNPYAKPTFYDRFDPRLLWAALGFFILSGIYHTYTDLSAAGQNLTANLPVVQKTTSEKSPTLIEKRNTGASKKASPPTLTASAEPSTAPTTATPTILPPFNTFPANALELGEKINAAWFGQAHWPALKNLWTRESNWNPNARNRSSGACGIPQALPCSKIQDMTPKGQIEWGLAYIERRYKNPTNAWRHFQSRGWY